MIITNSAANPRYGTDPTAAGVRAFNASVARLESAAHAAPAATAPTDLARLYPNLFAEGQSRSAAARAARAVSAAASAVGSIAAALVAVLHK